GCACCILDRTRSVREVASSWSRSRGRVDRGEKSDTYGRFSHALRERGYVHRERGYVHRERSYGRVAAVA
ncbi:MAG: hypothetical protein ACYC4B_33620, partial [Pirellulaceae bacterium]